MSLYSIENINTDIILGIWKKEESLDQLLDKVKIKEEEEETFKRFSNEGRKKEWLSTRLLLKQLTSSAPLIKYESNGKPFLNNSTYKISLSHSKNFIAILLSKSKVPGIDIEHIADRVIKVKHKFLSNEELTWCLTLEQLTTCWSVKEAIFKTIGEGVDFKDILIEEFKINKTGYLTAQLLKKNYEAYLVNYRIIENDVLTFTFREDRD